MPTKDTIAAIADAAQDTPDRESQSEIRARNLVQLELAKRPHQRDELSRNRALWAAKNVSSYRYTVSTKGAWGFDTGAILVTVRNGVTASTEYVRRPSHLRAGVLPGTDPQPEPVPETPYTDVPALFSVVERALDDPENLITVSYDDDYGFPATISADKAGWSDASGETIVSNFETLQ
jgi:Family of unknown function (DUF6174)